MSEEGMTIRKAVDEINESLSNAVPELVLLLVALQEKNVAPPPQLAQNIEVVAQTADVLGNVCTSLADDEYGDHPEIQKEIKGSAEEVFRCTKALRESVVLLSKGDLKKGYDYVMDTTKSIAGSCIKVLAIVYGAFFKRVVNMADDVILQCEDLSPALADEDPQAFADQVGDLSTRACEIAAHIRELARNEESPLAKQELEAAAAELDKRSDELLEKCNDFLADMGNAEKRKALEDEIEEFRKALNQQLVPVKNSQEEMRAQQEATHSRPQALADAALAEHSQALAEAEAARRREEEEAERRARAVPALATKVEKLDAEAIKDNPAKLKSELDTLRDLVNDFARTAEDGNATGATADAKAIVERQPVVVEEARSHAKKLGDPEIIKEVDEACRELNTNLMPLVAAGKAVLAKSDDDSAKKDLECRVKKANELLDVLSRNAKKRPEDVAPPKVENKLDSREAKRSAPAKLVESVGVLHEALGQLEDAAKAGDKEGVRKNNQLVKQIKPYVDKDLAAMCEQLRDPKARARAQADLKDLDEVLDKLSKAADKVAANPADKAALAELEDLVDQAHALGNTLLSDTKAEPLNNIEAARRENRELEKAAKSHKAADINKQAPRTAEAVGKVINELRDEAALLPKDSPLRKDLEAAAKELEDALTDSLRAAAEERENTDKSKEKELDEKMSKAADRVDKALTRADQALNPNKDALLLPVTMVATGGDPYKQSLEEAAPLAAQAVHQLMADLHTNKGDPEAHRKACTEVADILDELADSIKVAPEERVAAAAVERSKALQDLADAACHGDAAVVEAALANCASADQRLDEEVAAVAAGNNKDLDDPQRIEDLKRAAAQYEKARPAVYAAAKAAVANPGKRPECQMMAQVSRNALVGIADATAASPEYELAEAEEELREKIKELNDAVARGDAAAAEKAARAAEKAAEKVRDKAKVVAKRGGLSPDEAKAISERADKLAAAANEAARAARDWAKDPDNATKKSKVAKSSKDLEAALDDLDKLLDAARALAEKEKQEINKLANAVAEKHDPKDVAALAKEIVATQKQLGEAVKASDKASDKARSPEAKKKAAQDLRDLDELLPQLVAASKAAIEKPSVDNDDVVNDRAYEMRAKLNSLEACLDDGTPKGEAEKAVAEAQAAAAALARANKSKDPKAVNAALESLKKSAAKLGDLEKDSKSAFNDGSCNADSEAVHEAVDKFAKHVAEAEKAAKARDSPAVTSSALAMRAPLDTLLEQLNAPRSEAAEAKKKIAAAAIRARRGAVNTKKNNMDGLLKSARDLADSLRGFGSVTRDAAYSKGGDSAALALDELLRDLESGKGDAKDLLKKLPPPKTATAVTAETGMAGSISKVASQIENVLAEHKKAGTLPEGFDASPLSELIRRLSANARNNERQEMLITTRSIAAYLTSFCKDTAALSKRCKDPVYQDGLIRASGALRNFGTQLKIVTAVKAASSVDDSDADDQVISVTQSLGKAFAEALNAIQVTKKAGLLVN